MLYFKLLSLKKEDMPLGIYSDISPELSDRIYNNLPHYKGFDNFADILKTKQYTHTRITRVLTHILLDIKKEDMELFITKLYPNRDKPLTKNSQADEHDKNITDFMPTLAYARLLGMNKNKSGLLRNIKNIPLITKVADADKSFERFLSQFQTDNAFSKKPAQANKSNGNNAVSVTDKQHLQYMKQLQKMFKYDLFAAELYRFCTHKHVPDEYRAGVYILH